MYAEIDQKFGPFIAILAAAADGNEQARTQVNGMLALLDASDQMRPVAEAVRWILTGERDWQSLSTGLVPQNALILRRALGLPGITTFA